MKFFIWTLLQCICSHSQLITIIYRFITRPIYFSLWPLLGSIRMPLVVFVEYHRKHLGFFFVRSLSITQYYQEVVRFCQNSFYPMTTIPHRNKMGYEMCTMMQDRNDSSGNSNNLIERKKKNPQYKFNNFNASFNVQLYSSPCKREHECLTHICD